MDESDLNPEARLSRAALTDGTAPGRSYCNPFANACQCTYCDSEPRAGKPMPSFSHVLLRACLSDRRAGSIIRRRFCFITTRSCDPLCPVCPVRGSACRAARSAVAAATRCFNGLPPKLCSISRRPHGSGSLPERRFRISRRLTVLRSRALSARCEFCLSWFWLFTWLPSCLFGKEDSFCSLWLTARTTDCPATRQKGALSAQALA